MEEKPAPEATVWRTFNSFGEYYSYYLSEHRNKTNRRIHLIATVLFASSTIAALLFGRPVFAPVALAVGFLIASLGHVLVEHNNPKSVRAPIRSVLADFLMCIQMLTGKLPL